MQNSNRLRTGIVNREKKIKFRFNKSEFFGYEGDTLASALLANGQHLVGRSFKYHRPRGIFAAGSEEPNAMINLKRDGLNEPNVKATVQELFEDLEAESQNHRGKLEFDFLRINDFLHPFFSAGFYYKTFMWPKSFWEKVYEPIIRAAAGLGSLSPKADPDVYDKGFLHCDVLVIGSGPAGLISAYTAAKSGAKVILAEEDFIFGGRLNSDHNEIDGMPSFEWVTRVIQELESYENVRLLKRTSVYGVFDHGIFGALERKRDYLSSNDMKPRQILWKIYAKKSILCSGATERSIMFGNNDRPGIMLSSAVRSYVNRWGVSPGKKITLFVNNSDGWRTAKDLTEAGCNLAAIIDARSEIPKHSLDVPVYTNSQIVNTKGNLRLKSVMLQNGSVIKTDCLAVSGGWNPNVHLTCHQGGRPKWEKENFCFVPGNIPKGMHVSGSVAGQFTLSDCFSGAAKQVSIVLNDLGVDCTNVEIPKTKKEKNFITPLYYVAKSKGRAWVDLQNDVTSKDILQSYKEGFKSVEHVKRYTTLGMATDQGKNSNVLGIALLAFYSKKTIAETGTTIFRPPYTPIPIGALGAKSKGQDFKPFRLTPSHNWAAENGATFVESGNWLRAQWFSHEGEQNWRVTVDREVTHTRRSVGVCDVTTLGKIDIKGKDAGEFLNRVYANNFGKLSIGKVRYGLMLREDGIAYDDGTTARFDQNHFVMTTTTANAVIVFRNLEFYRQCLWPELDVHLISTTDAWAQFAIAGPNSRKLLQEIIDEGFDISNENFPFMACNKLCICNGIEARLFRISFSGELAYELAVPRKFGDGLIRALMKAGKQFNVVPYGTEALGVMRIEKGHAAGNELNGQTTAQNLGMAKMVNKNNDCIGNILSERDEFNDSEGLRLVGIRPVLKNTSLTAGAHFFAKNIKYELKNDEGWMTSVAFSPTLGHSIGLGYLKNGSERINEKIMAVDLLNNNTLEVEVVSPHFVDPKGERLRA